MIPFVNIIAGILIGVFTGSWQVRILASLAWGIIFCLYVTIAESGRRHAFLAKFEGRRGKWGMSPLQSFYFIEYGTSVLMALPIALLSGWIKGLF